MPTVPPIHFAISQTRTICGEAGAEATTKRSAVTCQHCINALAVTKVVPRPQPKAVEIKPVIAEPAKADVPETAVVPSELPAEPAEQSE